MKKHELNISYYEFETEAELPVEDRELLQRARTASNRAYAPYSNFNVGAALRLANGEIMSGNNQENVAYPSGLCAERVAIFSAGAKFPDQPIAAMAVTCHSPAFEVNEPLSPCGACRQAIAEYEVRHRNPIRIILAGHTGKIRVVESISDLLPFMFKAEELKKR